MDSCQQQQLKKQLKIHDKVLIDHQLKVHEKSEAMGISTEWMHHIIMQELDTSKVSARLLTPEQKHVHCQISK